MKMSRLVNPLDAFGTQSPSATDPLAAIRAAGGAFGLKKISLAEFSGQKANPDLHVVVRSDTREAIGQVGNHYTCYDNERFFVPVASALIKTGARITRFQQLDNGARAFMRLAWDSDHNLRVGGKVGDIVGRRCMLSTSHDGKWAAKFSLEMLRLACSNGMILPVGAYDMSLFHTVSGEQQIVELTGLAPVMDKYVRRFSLAADLLAKTPIKPNDPRCLEIVRRIVDPQESAGVKKGDGSPNRGQVRINRVMSLFDGGQPGADNRAVANTGWGLFQAVNHFYNHDGGTRGEDTVALRFKSLLPGGQGQKSIVRAWNVVTAGLGVDKELESALVELN